MKKMCRLWSLHLSLIDMKNLISACIIITVIVFGFSCSEQKEIKPLTYTKIFSGAKQKTWVLEKAFEKKNGVVFQEINFASCEIDDQYTFYANDEKKYEITNGSAACPAQNPDEPEEDILVDHTWSFVNASATLSIAIPRVFGYFIVPFTVKEATKDRMVLEIFANVENTITYEIHFKAVKEE